MTITHPQFEDMCGNVEKAQNRLSDVTRSMREAFLLTLFFASIAVFAAVYPTASSAPEEVVQVGAFVAAVEILVSISYAFRTLEFYFARRERKIILLIHQNRIRKVQNATKECACGDH